MRQNNYQYKNLFALLLSFAIAISAFAQAPGNEEPIKVSYRKSYEYFVPSWNLPWRYCYVVFKDKTYADGRTETETFFPRYTYMVSRSCYSEALGDLLDRKSNIYITLRNGTKVYIGNTVRDKDFAHADTYSKTIGSSYVIVERTETGVPDLSALSWEVKEWGIDDYSNGRDLSNYTSSIYSYQGAPLHYNSENPVEGWYTDSSSGYGKYLDLYLDHSQMRRHEIHFTWDDQILYLDGQLFDFAEFKPTYDFDLRVSDSTMPDGSPAKVFTFECKMKYLDHDFYCAIIDTVYQLPQ